MRTPPPTLRCPKCFGRSFKLSAVQTMGETTIWICAYCFHDDYESFLKDNTPDGCAAVCKEVEEKL